MMLLSMTIFAQLLIKLKKRVAKFHMTNKRLFPLEMQSGKMYACNISNANKTRLWNYRYGHLPVKSMSLLQK